MHVTWWYNGRSKKLAQTLHVTQPQGGEPVLGRLSVTRCRLNPPALAAVPPRAHRGEGGTVLLPNSVLRNCTKFSLRDPAWRRDFDATVGSGGEVIPNPDQPCAWSP